MKNTPRNRNPETILRSVSLPRRLAKDIERIARQESRSVSGQIVFFLQQCVSQRETRQEFRKRTR